MFTGMGGSQAPGQEDIRARDMWYTGIRSIVAQY